MSLTTCFSFIRFFRSLRSSLPLAPAFRYWITLSARASAFGGTPQFWIFDPSVSSGQVLDTSTLLSTGFRLLGHRITRSALANTFGGIVKPICFAALRLTNSNFVGLLNRQVGRLGAFQYLVPIHPGVAVHICNTGTVAHEPIRIDPFQKGKYCRERVLCCNRFPVRSVSRQKTPVSLSPSAESNPTINPRTRAATGKVSSRRRRAILLSCIPFPPAFI